MQNKFDMKSPIQFTGGILFIIASFSAGSQSIDPSDQSTLQTGSVEIVISPKEQSVINQNSLNQSFNGADDCDRQFPFPASAQKADPYGEKESEICKRLQIRGQRMQCEIDALLMEKPVSNTTGAKIELASWARCNGKVANLLIEGYYLPASEIERRLQICSSNYYADPGKMPAPGWYQRFLKWYTSNDLTPPPTDAALEVALKQSTPLESRQDSAGLMKCEWMFSNSRTPQIDPLPSSSNNIAGSNSDAKIPTKKPTKK
ncbi:hypothetical protein [Polynucleobacter sp. JS-Mosq-20-D10]|uniref:hypothetical protein n=1 Tax=Polynucleobacter sp. JS-Mosq-20-D10 TaxID=2576922 RepID=UPI001BFD1240|nr:hypothetical protein [Polynucleobacter sp. JS-Mosq-20-D10]